MTENDGLTDFAIKQEEEIQRKNKEAGGRYDEMLLSAACYQANGEIGQDSLIKGITIEEDLGLDVAVKKTVDRAWEILEKDELKDYLRSAAQDV